MPPYVAEMPLAGLKTAELFLLTTLRLWLAGHGARLCRIGAGASPLRASWRTAPLIST